MVRRRQTQTVCGVINHQDRGKGRDTGRDGKVTHVESPSFTLDHVNVVFTEKKMQLYSNYIVKIEN